MTFNKRYRPHASTRGRFIFCRAFDVLHIYTRREDGGGVLAVSIEPRGAGAQVRFRNYRGTPFAVRTAGEALQLLRTMRRYA